MSRKENELENKFKECCESYNELIWAAQKLEKSINNSKNEEDTSRLKELLINKEKQLFVQKQIIDNLEYDKFCAIVKAIESDPNIGRYFFDVLYHDNALQLIKEILLEDRQFYLHDYINNPSTLKECLLTYEKTYASLQIETNKSVTDKLSTYKSTLLDLNKKYLEIDRSSKTALEGLTEKYQEIISGIDYIKKEATEYSTWLSKHQSNDFIEKLKEQQKNFLTITTKLHREIAENCKQKITEITDLLAKDHSSNLTSLVTITPIKSLERNDFTVKNNLSEPLLKEEKISQKSKKIIPQGPLKPLNFLITNKKPLNGSNLANEMREINKQKFFPTPPKSAGKSLSGKSSTLSNNKK